MDVRLENPAGLAGIWAEENTRESLFDAMQRKEMFGTSGPRISVRLFGGWDFSSADAQQTDWVKAAMRRACRWARDLPATEGRRRHRSWSGR